MTLMEFVREIAPALQAWTAVSVVVLVVVHQWSNP